MKAAIWARVSTDRQETENQIGELRAYAARRGLTVVEVVTVEESAWKGKQRKALGDLVRRGRSGAFDVLLVWALDRLTREGMTETVMLVKQIEDQGVQVHSMQEDFMQSIDPFVRELVIGVFGWLAAMESRRRSERTKAGMARAVAAGKSVGRPRRKVPVTEHPRFAAVAALVEAGHLNKEEAARKLRVRKADLIVALASFRKGVALEATPAESASDVAGAVPQATDLGTP